MRNLRIRCLISFIMVLGVSSPAHTQTTSGVSDELVSDFKYIANNGADDAIDVATAPLHIGEAVPVLTSPRFYLVLGSAGALWGGSYALDQTLKSHLRAMSSSDANLLEDVSYGTVSAATAVLYGWGLYSGDSRARQYRVPGRFIEFYTLRQVCRSRPFGKKSRSPPCFPRISGNPSTSEKTAHEDTIPTAFSPRYSDDEKSLENRPSLPLASVP